MSGFVIAESRFTSLSALLIISSSGNSTTLCLSPSAVATFVDPALSASLRPYSGQEAVVFALQMSVLPPSLALVLWPARLPRVYLSPGSGCHSAYLLYPSRCRYLGAKPPRPFRDKHPYRHTSPTKTSLRLTQYPSPPPSRPSCHPSPPPSPPAHLCSQPPQR